MANYYISPSRRATCSACGKQVAWNPKSSRAEIVCLECRRKDPRPYGPRSGSASTYRDSSGKHRIDAVCEHCGEPFKSRQNGHSVTGWTRYCSRACVNKARASGNPRRNRRWADLSEQARHRRRQLARARHRVHQVSWDGVTDEQILERDRWMCWICKQRIGKTFKYPHKRSASIDHLIPLALGGDDTAFNKKAAHLGCNMRRGIGRQDEHPMLNFSLDPDLEITPRKRTYKPRPCKICGELQDQGLACTLHEPVFYAECRACGAPMIKRWRVKPERRHVCQECSRVDSRCAADGCMASGSFGKGYCAPHYHRLKRYGDVFSDIPLAHDRQGRLEVARLIRLRAGMSLPPCCIRRPARIRRGATLKMDALF